MDFNASQVVGQATQVGRQDVGEGFFVSRVCYSVLLCCPQEGDEDGYEADLDGSSSRGGQLDDDDWSDDGKWVCLALYKDTLSFVFRYSVFSLSVLV